VRGFCLFFFLVVFMQVAAYDDTPRCFYRLEQNFFNEKAVGRALNFHRYPQSTWEPITRLLKYNTRNIHSILRARGRKMARNPLEKPFQYKEAQELLLSTLYDIFVLTVQEFDINNLSDIDDMFDYLVDQSQAEIDECLVKPQLELEKKQKEEQQRKKEEEERIKQEQKFLEPEALNEDSS